DDDWQSVVRRRDTGGVSRDIRGRRELWPRANLGGDPLRAREEGVLERRAVRDRRVVRRDPPRVVEVAERRLGDEGEDLARPAAGQRALLHHGEPVRLLDRL